MTVPTNVEEENRLTAVRRYDVLDTPPDQAFDRLCALAARICNTPIGLVTIVDADRIWFKARFGLDIEEIDRDPGLCASAILQDDAWIIEDARTDPRTLTNPLVASDFGLQFYLGIPLRTHDGHNLGTLCVLDFEPRPATASEVRNLTDLASVVIDELELRLASARTVALEAESRIQAESLARNLQKSLSPPSLPHLACIELAAEYIPANREQVGGDFYDAFQTGGGFGLLVGDVRGHGPEAAALASKARHSLRALTAYTDKSPAQILADLNVDVMRVQAYDTQRHCTVALVRATPEGPGFTATVALAGHPRPRILRGDGSVEHIGTLGSLVGHFTPASFAVADTDAYLGPGDTLVMYTDGLTEASGSSSRFDEAKLDETLETLSGGTAIDIAQTLVATVLTAAPYPRDDIAILVASCL